jgi:ornithine decarboxylase
MGALKGTKELLINSEDRRLALSDPPSAAGQSEPSTARLDHYLAERRPPTPCVVIDLEIVRLRYSALREALPAARIYYAVKANPAPEIIAALTALGANFDLASPGEIAICQGLSVPAERLSFGNTIKR